MGSLFRTITPVSFVCMLGIIYLISQLFLSGRDYNIFAYVIIFIIFLAIAFAADRFLVSKFAYKKLVIFEFIFLAICISWYIYSSRYTIITIETTKPYFFVIYDSKGLKKSDIPSKGLFNKSITIKSDSNIHVARYLEYDAQVDPPLSWNYSSSSNKKEITLNNETVVVQIFTKGGIDEKKMNELLEEEVKRLAFSEGKGL